MSKELLEFKNALLARRVLAKTISAMEHPSAKARKDYLHEHPNADPKDHSVAKKEKGDSGDTGTSTEKMVAEAQPEHVKSKARFEDNKKLFSDMKDLATKASNGSSSAAKKLDSGYKKLYESGEKAAAAMNKILKKYENFADGAKGAEKREREAYLEVGVQHIRDWNSNKNNHMQKQDTSSHVKIEQAERTYGYAQQLEATVKHFVDLLKDPESTLDDSWRSRLGGFPGHHSRASPCCSAGRLRSG